MRVVFRADSSREIATGHLARCLVLADALRERGATIRFVCRDLPGTATDLVERRGHEVVRLSAPTTPFATAPGDPPHAAWLGVPWCDDAAETRNALGAAPDWLVVDHYALDERWERELRSECRRLLAIDDPVDRRHDVDVLVDQSPAGAAVGARAATVPAACRLLVGPTFALVRPEFRRARERRRSRPPGDPPRVLVLLGGVDARNDTERVLRSLALTGRRLLVDVVVGGGNPHRERIRTLAAESPGTTYHCQIDHLADLVAAADLAVGAGGAAAWERCCAGLPTVMVTIAENQDRVAAGLAAAGAVRCLGRAAEVTVEQLAAAVADVLGQPAERRTMEERARRLVDGRGADRVADAMRQEVER